MSRKHKHCGTCGEYDRRGRRRVRRARDRMIDVDVEAVFRGPVTRPVPKCRPGKL